MIHISDEVHEYHSLELRIEMKLNDPRVQALIFLAILAAVKTVLKPAKIAQRLMRVS